MDQAKAEGKVASDVVEKTWRDIGKADLAQLKALVAATPANPVLAGKRQTDGKQPGQDAGELNQAELAVRRDGHDARAIQGRQASPGPGQRLIAASPFLTFRTLP